jgi:hypothetical protein
MIQGQRVIPALRMTRYARSREFYIGKLALRNMTIKDPDGNKLRFMEPRKGPRPAGYTTPTQS